MKSKYIIVKGIVQGVGFRPFVFRLAKENDLFGNVKNTSTGVHINIEGEKHQIDNFIKDLKEKSPKESKIDEIYVQDREIRKFNDFTIINSEKDEGTTILSPDIAVCYDCLKELDNEKEDRRYKYAFINCTNCGPRYSIIKSLPYDRNKTTMKKFIMCKECGEEYENPCDRRFHAEPTCCKNCGPKLKLIDKNNRHIINEGKNVINKTKKLLKEGKIIAIKGIGGFHLVCDGTNYKAIADLRKRKNRKTKPLALMMKDINEVNNYCFINEKEKKILNGSKKPILILKKKNNKLPNNISFNNDSLGIMLPYSPLHYMLFDDELKTLVMTSGNLSGMPMIYKNEEALDKLNDIADYFLIHDRDIYIPEEDSVVKVILNEERMIRIGRGYAPINFKYKKDNIIALGSHMKNTFSLCKENYIFLSQYLGDMDTVESIENYMFNIKHLNKVYNCNPSKIIYDNHPNYFYHDYLKYKDLEKIGVYHHHAHIVSCMFENNIDEKVIGLSFDGIGYGEDKNLWGSEFLICDKEKFSRVGHLKYMKMPGGDGATKVPWKMAISLLESWASNNLSISVEDLIKNLSMNNLFSYIKYKNYKTILYMIKNDINTPLTSSMGRFFDGISALLNFQNMISYEGEACIELENLAKKSKEVKDYYDFEISYKNNQFIIDRDKIVEQIFKDVINKEPASLIAMKFHNTVVEFSFSLCLYLRKLYNINLVALSGGAFENEILLTKLYEKLNNSDFQVLTHKILPCNDSNISIGQMVIGMNKES